jgi:hypothetical protein
MRRTQQPTAQGDDTMNAYTNLTHLRRTEHEIVAFLQIGMTDRAIKALADATARRGQAFGDELKDRLAALGVAL